MYRKYGFILSVKDNEYNRDDFDHIASIVKHKKNESSSVSLSKYATVKIQVHPS